MREFGGGYFGEMIRVRGWGGIKKGKKERGSLIKTINGQDLKMGSGRVRLIGFGSGKNWVV